MTLYLEVLQFRICTSVIRILALSASELCGMRKNSDVVSPVKATSGHKIVSVICQFYTLYTHKRIGNKRKEQ